MSIFGEVLRISPYSVWMQENTDQNNSECGHFLRSVQCYYKYFHNPIFELNIYKISYYLKLDRSLMYSH